jgi:hypothetical protein
MPTIDEFAGSAALKGRTIQFETHGIHYRIVRIDERLYYRAHEAGVSIQDDYGHYLKLWAMDQARGGALGLAETYVALTMLLGETSQSYDDWKCSFSFPCLLDVKRDAGTFGYALHILDIRGNLNFLLYKLLADDDKRFDRMVVHAPFPEEFSREEINHFITFMRGYLEGYFETVKEGWHKWFFRTVPSECIVYGYQRGRFFNRQFRSEPAYRKAITKAEARQKLEPPTEPDAREAANG